MAEWLEEMVRCQDSLRLNCRVGFWTEQADSRAVNYVLGRRKHFRVLLRQVFLHYLITAIGLSGMLGFGGYLVLKGQLSLGQLVAAELVVWSLFKATEKLLRSCDAYFDLLTGLDKIGYITDLPTASAGIASLPSTSGAAELVLDGLTFSHGQDPQPLLYDISFKVRPGERVTVLGPTGVGKSTLLRLMAGYMTPDGGSVELEMVDLREMSAEGKAEVIGYLPDRNELFAGSVVDNVAVGRDCDLHRVRELLLETGGKPALKRAAGEGFSPLTSAGSTLSAGERLSIRLSRALLGRPRLLLIDDALSDLSEENLEKFLALTFRSHERPTVISTAALPQTLLASDRVLVLENGELVEDASPIRLADDADSRFNQLYPSLARAVRAQAKS